MRAFLADALRALGLTPSRRRGPDALGGRSDLVPWQDWRSQAEFGDGAPWLARDATYLAELAVADGARARAALAGYCVLCARQVDFAFAAGEPGTLPDWREGLVCSGCQLIQRHRLAVARLASLVDGKPRIFMTEHASRLFAWLAARLPDVVGSEYVRDDATRQRLSEYLVHLTEGRHTSVRHEDATALTLPTASRDAVLSFDVLEHVPDYRQVLREFARILRRGGWLVMTIPFGATLAASLLRARLEPDGAVTHLLEPEYHGDPTSADGCLAFHTFGWDVVDAMRSAGFRDVALVDAWMPALGFLGFNGLFVARR